MSSLLDYIVSQIIYPIRQSISSVCLWENPLGSTSHASLYVLSNSAVCLVVLLEVHLCLPLVQVQFNFQRNISKVLLQISSADDVFKNTIWI